ncbi:MAG: Rieske (2Fe-2S) protein, partial [Micrococcales bacterium]|nr:Rieske (2Fe-2S) protein [Micrococcales bacterium]
GSAGTIALGGVSLAACGGGGEGPKPTPVSGIPAAEIPLHGGKVFADAHVVVTHPAQGTFKAFDAICPHQGCLVSQIVKDTIRCPCHGSTFDADTGERLSGPAPKGLTPLTLSESGSTLDVS